MKERLSCYRGVKLLGIVVLVLLILSLYSGDALCASTLTRDKAAVLIKNSAYGEMLKSEVKLRPVMLSLIRRWAENNVDNVFAFEINIEKETEPFMFGSREYYKYFFGPLGTKDFIGFKCSEGICSSDRNPDIVVLRKPADIKIKVTGITGSGIARRVEYTWEYVNLPVTVKNAITKGGSGEAGFKLYDDGWRLINNYYLYYDADSILLSEKEKTEVRNISRGYVAKAEMKNKQLLESQTPTQQIGSFKLHRIVQTGYSPVDASPSADVEISDVNITVTPTEHSNVGQVGQSVVWFGDIITVEKSYNSDKNTHIISLALGKQQPVPGVTVAFNQPLYEKELQLSSESESDISKASEELSLAIEHFRNKYTFNASIGEKLYTGDFPFNKEGQPCIKCHSLDKRATNGKGQGPNLFNPKNPFLVEDVNSTWPWVNFPYQKNGKVNPGHTKLTGIDGGDLGDIRAFIKEKVKQSSK